MAKTQMISETRFRGGAVTLSPFTRRFRMTPKHVGTGTSSTDTAPVGRRSTVAPRTNRTARASPMAWRDADTPKRPASLKA